MSRPAPWTLASNPFLILGLLVLAALLGGCAGVDVPPRLPQIPDSDVRTRLHGKVVWHDLLSQDPQASRYFYAGLFDWHYEDHDLGDGTVYTLIRHRGRPIGGIVDARGSDTVKNVSRWVPVLSVPDVDAAIAFAESRGGRVLQAPIDVPTRGRMAVIGDDQGAVLSLLQPRVGDPPDRRFSDGDWLWDEVWSADPDRTLEFYSGLIPAYSLRQAEGPEEPYRYLVAAGAPRVGILRSPVAAMPATWMPYVKVANPRKTKALAKRLGGRVQLPARANPRGGEVAIINDPTGAGLLVQSWKP